MLATYVPRLALTYARSVGRRRLGPLDEVRLPMRAWPVDLDIYLHVNNGRYLTLMDFGRFQLTVRTGMASAMMKNGWRPIVGAAEVRFRKELLPLQRFELVTRLAGWEEKWFFIEHRIERRGTLHASAFVRGVLKKGRQTVAPAELLRAVGYEGPPPPATPELAHWLAAQPQG